MIALVFACMIAVAYSATTMGPTDAATTMGPTDAATTMGPTDAATTMAPAATTDAPAATTMAATTAAPAVTKILYDLRHHVAIIVRTDGCYEYHLKHQDLMDAQDANRRPLLETKMTQALASATAVHEMGHHHIDHMTSEIKTACASLPVFGFHH